MQKQVNAIVIEFFMNSSEFEFKDYDLNEIMSEVKPLIEGLMNNYMYIKKNEKEKGFISRNEDSKTPFGGGVSAIPKRKRPKG